MKRNDVEDIKRNTRVQITLYQKGNFSGSSIY